MRLLHLVLAVVVTLVAVSNDITTTANEITTESNSIHSTALTDHVDTRKLSDNESDEERRGGRGGGGGRGGRGGGGRGTSRGTSTQIYGTHTSIGLMNTNSINHRKTKEKCGRFTNWFKRLFDTSIKKCPKKGEEEEEYIRRLRA